MGSSRIQVPPSCDGFGFGFHVTLDSRYRIMDMDMDMGCTNYQNSVGQHRASCVGIASAVSHPRRQECDIPDHAQTV
eukprot:2305915-Prymnesium_polylepis.1